MKKLLFVFALFVTVLSYGQITPMNIVEIKGITTAVRDGYTPPAGSYPVIYNTTTGQHEKWDGSAWQTLSAASDENDFLTSVTRLDNVLTFVVSNQTDPTIDLSDLDNYTGAELETKLDAYFGSSAWRTQDGTGTDDQTASEVSYSNSTSGLTASNVQAALDEIEARTDTNDAKVGITPTQASDITTNNAKISYTDAAAVSANTAKVSADGSVGTHSDVAIGSAAGSTASTLRILADSNTDGTYSVVDWTPPTGGGGEANTTSNLGAGEGLAATKSGVDLPFKSLVAGTNISLSSDANTVTINSTGGGGDLLAANNLSDLGNIATARTNLGLGSAALSDDADFAGSTHTHATTDITSGTFADARVAESNVTQHQAALTITESQISDRSGVFTDNVLSVAGADPRLSLIDNSGTNASTWYWLNDGGIQTLRFNDAAAATRFEWESDGTFSYGSNQFIKTDDTNVLVESMLNSANNPVDEYVLTYEQSTGQFEWQADAGAGTGVTDGDKGDITVSGSGATWTVDDGAIAAGEVTVVDNFTNIAAGTGDVQDVLEDIDSYLGEVSFDASPVALTVDRDVTSADSWRNLTNLTTSALTLTVPTGVGEVGDAITFTNLSTGSISPVPGTGVTFLNQRRTLTSVGSKVVLTQHSTDTWYFDVEGGEAFVYTPPTTTQVAYKESGAGVKTATTANSMTLTLPSGIVADEYIFIQALIKETGVVWNTPTGYTLLTSVDNGEAGGSGIVAAVWYKKSDGTEGGTTVTVTNDGTATSVAQAISLVIQNADTTTPIQEFATVDTATASASVTAALDVETADEDNSFLMDFIFESDLNLVQTAPAGMTEAYQDQNFNGDDSLNALYHSALQNGDTGGTRTYTNNGSAKFWIVISAIINP